MLFYNNNRACAILLDKSHLLVSLCFNLFNDNLICLLRLSLSDLDNTSFDIDMLNERLEKRGYSMTATFTKRDGQENVMEEMLKQDKNISVLAGYSFDARA